MAKLNFGGVEENVVTREEFPLSKAQEVLRNETIAVIGYGVQGPGQALNQRDNGINVIVGQRKNSKSWDKAVNDGFVPAETLFEIEEALQRHAGDALGDLVGQLLGVEDRARVHRPAFIQPGTDQPSISRMASSGVIPPYITRINPVKYLSIVRTFA